MSEDQQETVLSARAETSFYEIPYSILSRAELTATTKLVYAVIRFHASCGRTENHSALAEQLGISSATVGRAIHQLGKNHLLAKGPSAWRFDRAQCRWYQGGPPYTAQEVYRLLVESGVNRPIARSLCKNHTAQSIGHAFCNALVREHQHNRREQKIGVHVRWYRAGYIMASLNAACKEGHPIKLSQLFWRYQGGGTWKQTAYRYEFLTGPKHEESLPVPAFLAARKGLTSLQKVMLAELRYRTDPLGVHRVKQKDLAICLACDRATVRRGIRHLRLLGEWPGETREKN